MQNRSVAIIGAGFSGTLLAIHLLRQARPGTQIHLIERSSRFATGLAYGTAHAGHVLNVPAGRMGAFPDRPDDFLSWLRVQPDALADGMACDTAFVPRQLYGKYLRSLLVAASLEAGPADLRLVNDEAIGADDTGDAIVLTLASGRSLRVDAAILAMGNFSAPAACMGLDGSSLWRASPWQDGALSGIDPASRVLLIGTGLTMVDAAIALLDGGHAGPIHAVSRRGLLPRVHAAPAPHGAPVQPYPIRLAALMRLLRHQAAEAMAEGRPWQGVIDAVRPLTQELWQAMSLADKRRFLRHVRCWWDIFRHRMAPAVAARIEAACASGQLRITAGRIIHCETDGDRMDVLVRLRAAREPVPLRVARAITCTGLTTDITRVADPLLRTLHSQGLVRPDPLSLGLDVVSSCAVVGRAGGVSGRLYAVGPMTKGVFWEIIAVPDIRRQCDVLAQHLAERWRA